jgi:hypothetical protein
MHRGKSTIARRRVRPAMSTTPAPLHATPERPRDAAPRASRPTLSDATVPAESVRVTDRPGGAASPGARAYLVERGLTLKDELDALIVDYLAQAKELAAVPMSVVPAGAGCRRSRELARTGRRTLRRAGRGLRRRRSSPMAA